MPSFTPRRKLSISILAIILFLSTFGSAQVGTILDKSKLPSCALNCQLLTQAQSLCVPPIAPVESQATYQTCFCNSNYLVNYKAGQSTGVCDSECTSASDRTTILQWYTSICGTGAAIVTPNAAATVSTTTVTHAGSTATASTSASSTNSGGSGGGNGTWIGQHWKWILMLAILFFVAIIAIVLGLWFKRRQERRYALGGHNHNSMLAADEAANTLRDRHHMAPSSVSQVHTAMPSWDNSVLMSGGGGSSKDHLPPSRGTGRGVQGPFGMEEEKTNTNPMVKELGIGGSEILQNPEEDWPIPPRSASRPSKRLSKSLKKSMN